MAKTRLDQLMIKNGLATTRDKAKRLIMAGLVFSGTQRMDKPGVKIPHDTPLSLKGKDIPYVGRAGLKLEKALHYFNLDLTDKVMVDVGASTGGFTDCALQNGARMSYAVDVGYNQLAWTLRQDNRVVVMEQTNFRHITSTMFSGELPDFAAVDVSFISLDLILPPLTTILKPGSDVIALIKPQFEAGRDRVGKKGVVRDKQVHRDVLTSVIHSAGVQGLQFYGATHSGITGGSGNIEFLAHFGWQQNKAAHSADEAFINKCVDEAHHYFFEQG